MGFNSFTGKIRLMTVMCLFHRAFHNHPSSSQYEVNGVEEMSSSNVIVRLVVLVSKLGIVLTECNCTVL